MHHEMELVLAKLREVQLQVQCSDAWSPYFGTAAGSNEGKLQNDGGEDAGDRDVATRAGIDNSRGSEDDSASAAEDRTRGCLLYVAPDNIHFRHRNDYDGETTKSGSYAKDSTSMDGLQTMERLTLCL